MWSFGGSERNLVCLEPQREMAQYEDGDCAGQWKPR